MFSYRILLLLFVVKHCSINVSTDYYKMTTIIKKVYVLRVKCKWQEIFIELSLSVNLGKTFYDHLFSLFVLSHGKFLTWVAITQPKLSFTMLSSEVKGRIS